jgi:undecaprenyl diphosphate synthase
MTLNIAFNYGARAEIVDAVRSIVSGLMKDKIGPEAIDEEFISSHLYTKGQPDPDF